MLAAYRRLGADLPFGDPRQPHDVAMEGWFWRFTDAAAGTVVVVLAARSRRADGTHWGTVGVALHPGSTSVTALVPGATSAGPGLALALGDVLRFDGRRLEVALEDVRVDAELEPELRWPRWAFGGIGPAHAVPGLSQYWHPWLLHARVRGSASAGARRLTLDAADAYAEKNWAPRGGFPAAWWWGQAHGFPERPDLAVAFAGGRASLGPLRTTATALVVAEGGRVHRVVRPLLPLRVAVGEDGWRLQGRTAGGLAITVRGRADGGSDHLLPVPLPEAGRHHEQAAHQHLAGELHVRLRRGRRVIYDGTSQLAGLEQGRAPATH